MYSMLLVDDESATREGLLRLPLWHRLGIRPVLQAADGVEALEVLAQERPDILLTDVKMPRMGGAELARRARALYPEIKIVFISGYDDIGYVKSALAVAAYDYIFKPVDIAELEACFNRVIESLGAERADRQALDSLLARSRAGERVIRDHLLGIVLTNPQVGEAALGETLAALDIATEGRHMTALAIRALGDGGLAVVDILPPPDMQSYAYVMDHLKGQYALLLETRGPISEERLMEIARKVMESLRAQGLAYAAVGLEAEGTARVAALGERYRMAQEALAHCIYQPPFSVQAYGALIPPGPPEKRPAPLEEGALLARDAQPLEAWLSSLMRWLEGARRPDMTFYMRQFSRWVDGVAEILSRHFRFDPEPEDLSSVKVLDTIAEAPCLEEMMARLRAYCHDARNILLYENDATIRQSVHQAVQYIHENYSQPLTIAQLATQAYLSPAYLSMLFRKELGMTVNGYITRVRMEKAKEMLRNPAMKQYDISVAIGYANPSYFVVQFKKYAGVTPSEYRNHHLVDGL